MGGAYVRSVLMTLLDRVRGTRRGIRDHFFEREAVWPESAIPYAPPTRRHAREFGRLFEAGIIRAVAGGRFYMHQFALRHARDRAARRAVPWVIVAAVAISYLATRFYVDASQLGN
ncbi:MAG: hypothetical protein E7773_14910 [Sphingomonas sp.]|uniref:hypothetical protein n=1 Tax=Sphingomonas sp. TaxID=28214 RepID=UPI0012139E38|nr:hypothetical protein [Sphingomonas sp.]THD34477.1 MAG: hypothetical protein E7773_14910 [Sphingomonas sp.]